MPPTLEDVLSLLERIAPSHLAEPWDNPGLQVRSRSTKIRRIAIALDPTISAMRSASHRDAQILLTHHPLIFKPLTLFDLNTYRGDVIFEALKEGISVICAHTNLDAARGGINDILADLLDLRRVKVLLPAAQAPDDEGLGRVGDLPEPRSLSHMVEKVKQVLDTDVLKVVGDEETEIRRVAVVGGSGGSLVPAASKKRADLLLTGDVGHHHALEARSLGLCLIDGGHFRTESAAFKVFARSLSDEIRAQGWEVHVEILTGESDPARMV